MFVSLANTFSFLFDFQSIFLSKAKNTLILDMFRYIGKDKDRKKSKNVFYMNLYVMNSEKFINSVFVLPLVLKVGRETVK